MITPPWIAAPKATASSGLTDWFGLWPVSASTASCTAGIRVEPPTKITSSMSALVKPASFKALRTGILVLSTNSSVNWLNWARVKVVSKWRGPLAPAVINGKEIWAWLAEERSFLAFSAASFKRCIAILSLDKSIPFSDLKLATNQSMMALSKSSPPRWVSPLVESTSKTPSPNSRMDTSKVPPPRSKTKIFSSLSVLSKP